MKKNIQMVRGGEGRFRDADIIIAIHRNRNVENPRIKIIRNKFRPAKDE